MYIGCLLQADQPLTFALLSPDMDAVEGAMHAGMMHGGCIGLHLAYQQCPMTETDDAPSSMTIGGCANMYCCVHSVLLHALAKCSVVLVSGSSVRGNTPSHPLQAEVAICAYVHHSWGIGGGRWSRRCSRWLVAWLSSRRPCLALSLAVPGRPPLPPLTPNTLALLPQHALQMPLEPSWLAMVCTHSNACPSPLPPSAP